MIRSMTGFGKGSEKCQYGTINVEIKTLNHRSLSVSCTSFNGLFLLEEKVQKVLAGKLFRGKVFVKVSKESSPGQATLQKVIINEKVAKTYLRKVKELQKAVKVPGEIQIRDILNVQGVIETASERKEEKLWPYIKAALEKAVESLTEYRDREGAQLAKDFNKRLKKMEAQLKSIRKYEKQSVLAYRKKLSKTIEEIAEKNELDKGRLEAEVALFARNCDIAEEITRLDGHISSYKDALENGKADVGKKLDFIAQEMQRETNTIGAKSSDFRISKAVIEVKSEIEKMREQINNIE